jgi:hypothetical protein
MRVESRCRRPAAPVAAATTTETSILITWSPPPSETPIAYNAYKKGGKSDQSRPRERRELTNAPVIFDGGMLHVEAVQKVASVTSKAPPRMRYV